MTSWRKEAACLGMPLDLFFPKQKWDAENVPNAIRQICNACPVAMDCLEYALSLDTNVGIWAATTPRQREAIRKYRAQLQGEPKCGTMDKYRLHRKRKEKPCRECQNAANQYEANRRRGGYIRGART